MDDSASKNQIANQRTSEFLDLLGQHERRLQSFVVALVPHLADADEIVQQTRLRLWEQFDQYDRARDFGV